MALILVVDCLAALGSSTPGGFWNGSFLSQVGSGFSLGINISANTASWVGIAMKAISLTSQGISLSQNIIGHKQNERSSKDKGDDDDWNPLNKADLQLYFRQQNN